MSSEKNTVIKRRIINYLLIKPGSVISVSSVDHVQATKTVQEGSAKVLGFKGRNSSLDPKTDDEYKHLVEDCPDHDCSCFNDEDDAKFS